MLQKVRNSLNTFYEFFNNYKALFIKIFDKFGIQVNYKVITKLIKTFLHFYKKLKIYLLKKSVSEIS